MAFLHKDDHCRVCGNVKTVEIGQLDDKDVVIATRECDPSEYRRNFSGTSHPVIQVFCSNCGIEYHEDSIS